MIFSEDPAAREPVHASTDEEHGDEIRALVKRLARAHPSGGKVVERAAILASGTELDAVLTWIADHSGQPEATSPAKAGGGLYASRAEAPRAPRRYVLPAEALDGP